MDFELSEEQRAFQALARDFAADKLAPHAAEWDENEIFPEEALRAAAALGFAGIYIGEGRRRRGAQPARFHADLRRVGRRLHLDRCLHLDP